MKNIRIFLVVFLLLNSVVYVSAQESLGIEIDEEFNNYLFELFGVIDEIRAIEQSGIVDYSKLQGTFWVREEPIITDWNTYYDGYIFMDNNCVISVWVIENPVFYTYMQKRLLISPNFHITNIVDARRYNIVDGKIVVFGEIFCYLEDTYLYFSIGDEFKKYRLESRFPIIDLGGDLFLQ
jgi:hypothetical protein